MSLRQGTTKRFTNTTPTVNWPSNTLEGSFLVAVVARNPSTTIVTDLPAPWVLVGANLQTNIGLRLYAFENAPIQESGGDAPDTVQITFSGATFGTLALLELDQAWRGGSAVQDSDFTAFGTGSAPSAGSVDTLTARAMVLGVTAARNLDVQIPHAGTAVIPGITGDGNPDPPAATTLNGNKLSLGLWLPSPDASAPGHYAMAADLTGAVSRDWCGVALAVKDATGGQAPLGFAISDVGADTLITRLTARGPRTFSLARSERELPWPESLTGAIDEAPLVTIQPADQISDTGATLHCLADPRGQAGTIVFDYTSVLDTGGEPVFVASTPTQPVIAAFGDQPVAAAVGGLAAVTTYYVRARVLTAVGTAVSSVVTFTTNTTPIIDGPPVFTVGVVSPSATQTTITASCSVDSNNSTSPSSSVDLQIFLGGVWTTFSSQLLAAGGFSYAGVATGLTAGTAYQIRAVATNPRGTTTSGPITVSTSAATPLPVPTVSPAQTITSTGAQLVGQVAHITSGSAVDCHFEWGTSLAYGNVVAAHHLTTALADDTQQVTDGLTGLVPSTTYHYRLVCSRADGIGGVIVSSDQVFTTAAAPAQIQPVPGVLAATGITQTAASLQGVVGQVSAQSPVTWQMEWGLTTSYGSTSAPQTLTFSSPTSMAVKVTGFVTPLGSPSEVFVDYGTSPGVFTSIIDGGQILGTVGQSVQVIVPNLALPGPYFFRIRAVAAAGTATDSAPTQVTMSDLSVQVNTPIAGLTAATVYHYRLRSTRTDGIGGTGLSPDRTFTSGSGPVIAPADDPDSDLFDPGSYSGWFAKFFGKGQFGVDPSCYSAATRTMVGSPTGAGADIQVWPTPQAGGRRLVMSTGGVPPDAVCPFKDTGDIPPTTPGAGSLRPDGCMYLVNAKGRCIRTNAEGTAVDDVTGYIVLHGASVVNGSIQSKNPDAVVAGDVSANMPFAPYNCQLVQRSQYLGSDLVTFGAASPVNAGGPSPTTPSQAARCGITIDNTAYLFDFSNSHLQARNCHSYFSGSGDIADATWKLIPSSIAAGSTKTPATGQASITCYFTASPLVKTTLASGYTAGGATMALVDASGLPASGFVALNEAQFVVQYTGKSTNTLTGCTLIVGVGTIASGKTVVQAVAQTTAAITAPWTTQKVADAVSALANSGGRANLGIVGLNNSGPWALQFNNGRDTVSNTGVFAASSGTTTAQQACYHVAVTANTLKDQAAANITFAAAVPIRSPYGTGGHPLALGGSTGTFTRWFNEFRYGDGNKTGKGAREMTVSYATDCLHPERFSTVSQAGHVDAFQTLGIDPDGNPTGWSNERSGKVAFHAVLIFNAGNTAIFWDTQGGDSEKSVTVDRLLAQGVNKAISLNGPDRQTTQRSYFAQDSANWYPNRFSASVTDSIDPRFDHVDTVVKTNWSGQIQNYSSDKWDVGWPDFHDGTGAPTAGMTSTQFKLKILTAFGNTYETAMITFSAVLATLQANIQAAVNAIIPAAGTSPDSSLVMPTGAPTGGTKNGWGAGIDFTLLPARTVKVSFQDGVGLVTQSPHARPVSTTWYGQLPDLSTHPLANRESLPTSGAYNILNRGNNGNGKDGCAQPLPPQAAAGNGSVEVINPTTFVVPVGAVTATSSADLVAKLQGSTPLDIYLPAGAYTSAGPVVYGAPHRLYGANPSTTTLNFGLNLAQLIGPEVHGVSIILADTAHAVTDPISGQLCAITNRAPGSTVAITDVILTGPASHLVGYGVNLNGPAGAWLERIVANRFAIGGVIATEASTNSVSTIRRATDIDVSDIAHQTAANRGLNYETGIRIGLKALDGVRRLRVRDVGLIGICIADSMHDTYLLDLDVDNVYGKIPSGWPEAGSEGGIALLIARYAGAQNPAVGSWKPCFFERYRLGPTIRKGIWCLPFNFPAPLSAANPASWRNVFDKGWIAATKNTITVPGVVTQAERWGIVFDDGTQFNQLDHTRFEGAFSNALANAAIRDRGGAWAWGQAAGSYVRPVSAGTSTTTIGGSNTGGVVAYG